MQHGWEKLVYDPKKYFWFKNQKRASLRISLKNKANMVYEDSLYFMAMKASHSVRQEETTSFAHIAAVILRYDAIDYSLRSPKGNHVFQVLECLPKRAKMDIRLKKGGLNSFVSLDREHSCKIHVV